MWSRLGVDTSSGSDLTPHWLLNNLLRQNTSGGQRQIKDFRKVGGEEELMEDMEADW